MFANYTVLRYDDYENFRRPKNLANGGLSFAHRGLSAPAVGFDYFSTTLGKIKDLNNIFVNVTNLIAANDVVFTPPYSYTPDVAGDVKSLATTDAGVDGYALLANAVFDTFHAL